MWIFNINNLMLMNLTTILPFMTWTIDWLIKCFTEVMGKELVQYILYNG